MPQRIGALPWDRQSGAYTRSCHDGADQLGNKVPSPAGSRADPRKSGPSLPRVVARRRDGARRGAGVEPSGFPERGPGRSNRGGHDQRGSRSARRWGRATPCPAPSSAGAWAAEARSPWGRPPRRGLLHGAVVAHEPPRPWARAGAGTGAGAARGAEGAGAGPSAPGEASSPRSISATSPARTSGSALTALADCWIGFAGGTAAAIRGGASRRRGSTTDTRLTGAAGGAGGRAGAGTGTVARGGGGLSGRTAIVSPQVLHFILKARPESSSETTYVPTTARASEPHLGILQPVEPTGQCLTWHNGRLPTVHSRNPHGCRSNAVRLGPGWRPQGSKRWTGWGRSVEVRSTSSFRRPVFMS